MSKAPQPSPVGLVIILILFVFLIWHGPWDERWGSKEAEVYVDDVRYLANTCSLYYTDWPCLEAQGCL